MKAIDVQGLSKRFAKKQAVSDLTFSVEAGQICGFLGPNGSGKTTTIRMLCGLLQPDSGSGTCLGLNIRTEGAAIRKQLGYMTQRFSLYEDLTIEENLFFASRLHNLGDIRDHVDQSLSQIGLGDRRHQLAGALSGGWKQRLALAVALIHSPKLLLLDEPTAGVDPKARRDFWDHIHELAEQGVTILVSTHYMDEAERCHEIAYIAAGRLLVKGPIDEVIESARLVTWWVKAPHLSSLAQELQGLPGIDQIATFGSHLHICGRNPEMLKAALLPFMNRPDLTWRQAPTDLEDVFIYRLAEAGRP